MFTAKLPFILKSKQSESVCLQEREKNKNRPVNRKAPSNDQQIPSFLCNTRFITLLTKASILQAVPLCRVPEHGSFVLQTACIFQGRSLTHVTLRDTVQIFKTHFNNIISHIPTCTSSYFYTCRLDSKTYKYFTANFMLRAQPILFTRISSIY